MKLLLIGSITSSEAKYPDGVRKRFGGGIMYGGRAAAKLEIETTVITVGADDIEPAIEELRSLGLTVVRVPRPASNNFSNDYMQAERKLYLRSFIETPLTAGDIKQDVSGFDSVILFPLFNEVSPSVLSLFSKQTVMLDPQGFTRELGKKTGEGLYPITQSDWKNIDEFVGKVDILKLSSVDLLGIKFNKVLKTEEERVQSLVDMGYSVVVLTRGENSTIVARKDSLLAYVETYKADNPQGLSPAGVGEIFAVPYLLKYHQTHDAVAAAKFGNACASLTISGAEVSVNNAKKLIETI